MPHVIIYGLPSNYEVGKRQAHLKGLESLRTDISEVVAKILKIKPCHVTLTFVDDILGSTGEELIAYIRLIERKKGRHTDLLIQVRDAVRDALIGRFKQTKLIEVGLDPPNHASDLSVWHKEDKSLEAKEDTS